MVAKLIKSLLLSVFFIVAITNASCEETTEKDQVIAYALEKVNSQAGVVKKQVENCRDKENGIEVDSLKGNDIPKKYLITSLYYLSDKARDGCERDVWASYFLTVSMLRDIQKHYGVAISKEFETETLYLGNSWRRYLLEIEYSKVPQKYRAAIESIDAFKQPFDPVQTIRNLGL